MTRKASNACFRNVTDICDSMEAGIHHGKSSEKPLDNYLGSVFFIRLISQIFTVLGGLRKGNCQSVFEKYYRYFEKS